MLVVERFELMGLRLDIQQLRARTDLNKHHSSPLDLVKCQSEGKKWHFSNRIRYRWQKRSTGLTPSNKIKYVIVFFLAKYVGRTVGGFVCTLVGVHLHR